MGLLNGQTIEKNRGDRMGEYVHIVEDGSDLLAVFDDESAAKEMAAALHARVRIVEVLHRLPNKVERYTATAPLVAHGAAPVEVRVDYETLWEGVKGWKGIAPRDVRSEPTITDRHGFLKAVGCDLEAIKRRVDEILRERGIKASWAKPKSDDW